VSVEQLTKLADALGTSGTRLLAETMEVIENLKRSGVRIADSRDVQIDSGIALLGAAAVGALIAKLLSK
jgi:hypothetical protein